MIAAQIQEIFATMRAGARRQKLVHRSHLVAKGRLSELSTLPYRLPIDVEDVSIDATTDEVSLSDRLIDALELTFSDEPDMAELGFDIDGSAHLSFADDQDRLMLALALEGAR